MKNTQQPFAEIIASNDALSLIKKICSKVSNHSSSKKKRHLKSYHAIKRFPKILSNISCSENPAKIPPFARQYWDPSGMPLRAILHDILQRCLINGLLGEGQVWKVLQFRAYWCRTRFKGPAKICPEVPFNRVHRPQPPLMTFPLRPIESQSNQSSTTRRC